MISFFIPDEEPTEMIRLSGFIPSQSPSTSGTPMNLSSTPRSTLVNQSVSSSTSSSQNATPLSGNQRSLSFKEECLKRLDNKAFEQPKVKRRQVNPYDDIVTSDAYFEKVFNELEEESEKEKEKLERKRKKAKAKPLYKPTLYQKRKRR